MSETIAKTQPTNSFNVFRIIGFISFFDRFATNPMLVILSKSLGISLASAVQLVGVYSLFYAIGQPLWGLLSDRIGRINVLKITLVGAAIGSLLSITIPGYVPLLIFRAFTGLMVGAFFPTILTLIGDRLEGNARYGEISNLQTITALGTTIATLIAGAISAFTNWRIVFAITLISTLVLFVFVRKENSEASSAKPIRNYRASFTRWTIWLYVLALFEGAFLLGILTYIVPAMEHGGVSVSVAGFYASIYGVGVILGSQLIKKIHLQRSIFILIGGVLLTLAFVVAANSHHPVYYALAAGIIGLSNSFLHSTLQGWATEISPTSRATTVSIFVSSLFLGSALITSLTAGLASEARFKDIFGFSAISSLILTVIILISFIYWTKNQLKNS